MNIQSVIFSRKSSNNQPHSCAWQYLQKPLFRGMDGLKLFIYDLIDASAGNRLVIEKASNDHTIITQSSCRFRRSTFFKDNLCSSFKDLVDPGVGFGRRLVISLGTDLFCNFSCHLLAHNVLLGGLLVNRSGRNKLSVSLHKRQNLISFLT